MKIPILKPGREPPQKFGALLGKPGVVYILVNEGLRHGYVKIGCTTRSGRARASELNADANTGTPGTFRCVFEQKTHDCGAAERRVFHELRSHRRGKRGQEFFEVDQQLASETITRVCAAVDQSDAVALARQAAKQTTESLTSPITSTLSEQPQPQPPPPRVTPVRKSLWPWYVAAAIGFFIWINSATPPPRRVPTPSMAPLPAPVVIGPDDIRDPIPDNSNGTPRHAFQPQAAIAAPADCPQGPLINGRSSTGRCPDQPPSAAVLESAEVNPDAPTPAERAAMESACGSTRTLYGPGAYNQCMKRQLVDLLASTRSIDLPDLSDAERSSIESACRTKNTLYGPASYNNSRSSQLADLKSGPRDVDLSSASGDERASIESACQTKRSLYGPAAYNRCLASQVADPVAGPRDVDLSAASPEEQASMQSACHAQHSLYGPAAYNRCLTSQLAALDISPRYIDLSGLSDADRAAVQAPCQTAKTLYGPAANFTCLAQKLKELQDSR
jgi:hypothetical protein